MGFEILPEASTKIIERTIKAVRKRAIAVRLYEGGALVGALFFLLVLTGTLLGGAFSYLPAARTVFQIIGLIALLYVVFKEILIPIFPLLRDEKIALLIEQSVPLDNAVITAVQLIKDASSPKKAVFFSNEIVALQISNTAEKLNKIDPLSVVQKTFLRRNFSALIASASLFVLIAVLFPAYISRNLSVFFNIQPEVVVSTETEKQVTQAIQLIIGDITLNYRYPLYTGLKPEIVSGSSGDIKAPKGSEVTITATSNQPLASGNIVVNESSVIPLSFLEEAAAVPNKKVTGTMTLMESGEYVFVVKPSGGSDIIDPARHKIILQDDNYPEITINYPREDIEVNEQDIVSLKYNARDDYGLSSIALVIEGKDRTVRKVLDTIRQRKLQHDGSYKWSISEVKIEPGEKLPYYLEATDNDIISGPKVSRSKTLYLYVHSAEEKHRELIRLQETLLKELVQLLADDLVKPVSGNYNKPSDILLIDQETIFDRTDHALNLFAEILDAMSEDSLANYSIYRVLENMRDRIRKISLRRRSKINQLLPEDTAPLLDKNALYLMQTDQDEEVVELENDIIFLDELIRKQKLEELFSDSQELTNAQESISKLLEELKEGYKPETMEKVMKQLKEIEELTRQMLEKVSKLSNEIPDEFLNQDALKGLEQDNVASNLQKMQEALSKGDLESALEAAERLLASLQQMMGLMQDAATMFADSAYSQTLKDIENLTDQIAELEQQEQDLASNTDALKRDVQERIYGKMDEELKEFFNKQQERLNEIQENLNAAKETLAKDPNLKDLFPQSFGSEGSARGLNEFYDRLRELARPLQRYEERWREREDESRFVREKSPSYRSLLSLARRLPKTEEKLSQLNEMLEGWDTKESLNLAQETLSMLRNWNNTVQRDRREMRPEEEAAGEESKEKDLTTEEKPEQGEEAPAEPASEEEELMDRMAAAEALNRQIVEDLGSLMAAYRSGLQEGLTDPEKNVIGELADRQGDVKNKARHVLEKLEELLKNSPIVGMQTDEAINNAEMSMGKAQSELDDLNVLKGLLGEREALYELAKAKKGMQDAKERLQKGVMGGGMPFPMYSFRGRMHEGRMGRDTEKVEIPTEEAYKVPKEFRQDIIDAMKEGLPEKYKKLNKDYYKSLVE